MGDKIVRIKKENQIYYGGDQKWFAKVRNQNMGCGIIASANLVKTIEAKDNGLYTVQYVDYISLAERIAKGYVYVLPRFGINGVFLSLGINLYFIVHNIPYIAMWGTRKNLLWSEIQRMLDDGLSVILAVGPNKFSKIRKVSLPLYVKNKGTYVCYTTTKAHYVTITDMSDDYLTVSSWGEKFFINKNELMEYAYKYSNFLFTNVLVVRRRRNEKN